MNIIELAKHVGGVADDQTVVLFHEELEAVARAIRAEALEEAAKVCEQNKTWGNKHWTAYEEAILEAERKRHAFELSMQEELFADKAEAIRAEALEEAAKVCDFENHQLVGMGMDNEAWAAKNCAAAIRGLK